MIDTYTTSLKEVESNIHLEQVISSLPPKKQELVKLIIDGHDLTASAKKMGVDRGLVYQMKRELKRDLLPLKNEVWGKVNTQETEFDRICYKNISGMPLSRFMQVFLADYDTEGYFKWNTDNTIIDKAFRQWENNIPTVVNFGNNDMKTTTVLSYLVYKLYLRRDCLRVIYFADRSFVPQIDKLRKLIRLSPILDNNLQPVTAKTGIRLLDGSILRLHNPLNPFKTADIAIYDRSLKDKRVVAGQSLYVQ